ncbi:hypothetical protein GCM10025789_08570 [Tessaracoccus lubricantis]|uniref:PRC-barrel domain-containing protein n=1 Tax=Tessaracoccus lubricantis TaxID=545543 RepID=A0ABP9F676_9ACTN
MHHDENIDQLLEATAYDRNGERIGGVSGVYLDDQTSQPMWVTVNTGLFGLRTSFAPLAGSTLDGERLTLAADKDTVKDAPNVDEDGHISRSQEDDLYRYYQVDSSVIEADRLRTRRWDRDHDLSGEQRSDPTYAHVHDDVRRDDESPGSPGLGNATHSATGGGLGSPGMGNEDDLRSRRDDLEGDPAYRNDPAYVEDQAALGGEQYVDDERLRDERLRDVGPDGEYVDDEEYVDDDPASYPDAAEGPLGERTRGARPIDNIFDAPDRGNPRPN